MILAMPRTDYFDDPRAPVANRIVVAVTVVVRDASGRLLMIRRGDSGLWSIPGGAQDIGETLTEAAIREVVEETGITIRITGLVGIYADPRHVIDYHDGEVRQEFSICFRGEPLGGALIPSVESPEVDWVDPDRLGHLDIHHSIRLRIRHELERAEPHYT